MRDAKRSVFILLAVVMIVLSVGLIAMKGVYGSATENRGKDGTRTFTGPVEKLVFEAGACDIEVVAGETEDYILTYTNLYYASLSDSFNDGVLTVTLKLDGSFPARLFSGNGRKDTKIVLTVPKDAVLEEASFEFGAADIEMQGITAKELAVTVGAGELDAKKLTATEKAKFSVGAGEFSAEDVELSNARLDCGVGQMELSGNLTGDSTVDCGVGQISLTLTGNEEEYHGNLSCGLGEISMGSVKIDGSGNKTYGTSSAESRMDIKCGIGEVDVRFH